MNRIIFKTSTLQTNFTLESDRTSVVTTFWSYDGINGTAVVGFNKVPNEVLCWGTFCLHCSTSQRKILLFLIWRGYKIRCCVINKTIQHHIIMHVQSNSSNVFPIGYTNLAWKILRCTSYFFKIGDCHATVFESYWAHNTTFDLLQKDQSRISPYML